MPHGCTFKGFPQHFTHQHAPSMLSSLMQSTTGLAIVQCKGEQARLAPRAPRPPAPHASRPAPRASRLASRALPPRCHRPVTSL